MPSVRSFLQLRILKNRNYVISVIGVMILFYTSISSTTLLPMYNQSMLGLTATVSGLLTLPGSLANALTTPVAGKLYDKHGIKRLLLWGGVLLVVSNFGMLLVHADTSPTLAAGLNVLRSLAAGLMYMPLITWGCSSIPKGDMAHGTALVNTMRSMAGSIGMVISVSLMTSAAARSALEGAAAQIHGMNTAFGFLGILCVTLLVVALISVRKSD